MSRETHGPSIHPRPGGAAAPPTEAVVIHRAVRELKLRRNNPRTHSEEQIRQIAKSIATFGFTNPVLIDANDEIVAGHGRVRAAKILGLERVPTICLNHLSPAQARAYVIADNRLAELAGWDRDLLSLELRDLAALDLDFDLEILGFETPELDRLIQGGVVEASDSADDISRLALDRPVVSRQGDLWEIGDHRLLCGNALDGVCYGRVLDGHLADAVFCDPPFNVPIDGHASGLGRIHHADFLMASGEMSPAEFTAFLRTAFSLHADHSAPSALAFVCSDWRHVGEFHTAGREAFHALANLCVWVKPNGGMGSLFRSQHELVFVFKVGNAPHRNNIELGRHGRSRTNVWFYAGVNSFGKDRDKLLALHPTIKPVRLVADAILDCTRRGDRVLDGFAGSGTTLLAAERAGRRGYGIELDPKYVDVAIRRLAERAGLEAIHAETGRSFDDVARERHASSAAETSARAVSAKESRDE